MARLLAVPPTFQQPGRPLYVANRLSQMAITVNKVDADGFVIEMTADGVSLSIRVSVPRRQGDRIFSDAEREKMAKSKATDAALNLAEDLVDRDAANTNPTQ